MSNLAPQNEVLNLTPSKTSTNSSSFSKTSKNKEHEAKDSENLIQDHTKSFLNSLLNSIDETNEFLPNHMKISQKEVISEAMSRLQKGAFDESDKISIFESASFMQILALLDKLRADTTDIKLPNLSTPIQQFIKTESNLNALKTASSLNELLDIAKSLGLNVKNIKVDRLLDLKATFPNLAKTNFFKDSVDSIFKELIHNKIAHVSKNLNHNLQNTHHFVSSTYKKIDLKDSNSLLSQTLKNLDSVVLVKKSKNEKTDKIKTKVEDKIPDIKSTSTYVKNDEVLKVDIAEHLSVKKSQNTSAKKESSNVHFDKASRESLKDFQNSNPIQENIILTKTTNVKENIAPKDGSTKENILIKYSKTDKDNSVKEVKQNSSEQKVNFENLNKIQAIQSKDSMDFANSTTKENFIPEQTKTQVIDDRDKNNFDDLNSLVKDLNKVTQNHMRNVTPKETLQYFSQDLKEAIEQYKAPITKLSITLNPNNLGEVEVTLMQRGNNLHINFNSNTNAMNLFIQNQLEFKNSLVNMGFTGLEMNFSDQGKKEQNQGKNRRGYGFKDVFDGKSENEKINLELVLAKYF